MMWNHPYGEDNFSIIIKCRKCYNYWLKEYNENQTIKIKEFKGILHLESDEQTTWTITKFSNGKTIHDLFTELEHNKIYEIIVREK